MPGPVALVGSGEYLPVMAPVEGALLAGRRPRYVQLPTAAAEEGPGSVARWVALGAEQAQRLGVEAVPVMVLDRAAADDGGMAQLVGGAGLIYPLRREPWVSGGHPSADPGVVGDCRGVAERGRVGRVQRRGHGVDRLGA